MIREFVNEGRVELIAFAVFAASLLISFVLVPAVRHLAHRVDAIDRPADGKAHRRATPYFGGVAIGIAALGVPSLLSGATADLGRILIAALMVAVTGLVDDLRSLDPLPRLAVEVVAASLAVSAGARIELWGPIGVVASVVVIVVITNSFNLLDNMDGCAGLIATATATALGIAAVLEKQVLVAGLAAGLAGACIGFLRYNWHPATIFMGDAGSLCLGFLLAVVALKVRSVSTTHVQSVVGVGLMLAVPLFDTTLVTISRRAHGLSIMQGGKDHTSHRLVSRGFSVRWVASLLGGAAALCALLGVLVVRSVVPAWFGVVVGAAALFGLLRPLLRMDVYSAGSLRSAG